MSIPTFLDVWADASGAEVEVQYRWPRPPEVRGNGVLQALVSECIARLGPYESEVTFPQVQSDLERQLEEAGLMKVAVVTERSLASEFLSAAVAEAEESAKQELDARTHLPLPPGDPIEFILFWTSLDRARRASRKAVMLAVASLEAFVNDVASTELLIWKEEDRLSLLDKWIIVPRALSGRTFDRGTEPFQGFQRLVVLRHKLVHPKTRRARLEHPNVDAGQAEAMFAPADDAALDSGRRGCIVARELHLEFSRLTGLECPDWVSVVPPSGSIVAEDWMGASIRAGLREDPDFPPRHEHPEALPFPWAGGSQPANEVDGSEAGDGSEPAEAE